MKKTFKKCLALFFILTLVMGTTNLSFAANATFDVTIHTADINDESGETFDDATISSDNLDYDETTDSYSMLEESATSYVPEGYELVADQSTLTCTQDDPNITIAVQEETSDPESFDVSLVVVTTDGTTMRDETISSDALEYDEDAGTYTISEDTQALYIEEGYELVEDQSTLSCTSDSPCLTLVVEATGDSEDDSTDDPTDDPEESSDLITYGVTGVDNESGDELFCMEPEAEAEVEIEELEGYELQLSNPVMETTLAIDGSTIVEVECTAVDGTTVEEVDVEEPSVGTLYRVEYVCDGTVVGVKEYTDATIETDPADYPLDGYTAVDDEIVSNSVEYNTETGDFEVADVTFYYDEETGTSSDDEESDSSSSSSNSGAAQTGQSPVGMILASLMAAGSAFAFAKTIRS